MWLLVLNACLCSLNLTTKLHPVCPTYALLQSGHVNLYAPEHAYLSGVGIAALIFLDCVGSAPGNLQVCFLKQVGDECCLFTNICE